jgi:hypothetical protein
MINHKYIKYKSNEKQFVGGSKKIQSGGTRKKNSSGGNVEAPIKVQYSDASDNIEHIGQFQVNGKILAGEAWNLELNLPKGIYNAYKSNNDLIIVHEGNANKFDKRYLEEIIFDVAGDIGVDTGKYGFYDDASIYKIIPKKSNLIGGQNIPSFDIPENVNQTLVTFNMLSDEDLSNKHKNDKTIFGAITYNGTGDGFFKCLVNDTHRIAVILGHE